MKGRARIGIGNTGEAHYGRDAETNAALGKCAEKLKDGYVAKIMNSESAKRELENSKAIRRALSGTSVGDYIILVDEICDMGAGRSVVFSKYGGPSVLSIVYNNGVPVDNQRMLLERIDDGYVKPNITADQQKSLRAALESLQKVVGVMNSSGVQHNDLTESNVVFDGTTARLIDFEDASIGVDGSSDGSDMSRIVKLVKDAGPKGGRRNH